LAAGLAGIGQRVLFEPGDGSVLQRLNRLYNQSKHVNKTINSSD
jgi:hypothetical protein